MKIIIEPETDEEKKEFGEKKIVQNVFEFGLIGRQIRQKMFENTFSFLHITDKCILEGKLCELKARLRNGR